MTTLREAAQQALNYWESASFGDAVMVDKMDALRAALAQQDEPVEDVLLSAAGLALDALEHDRQATARAGRSISMLSLRAIEELRGVFRNVLAQQAEPAYKVKVTGRWHDTEPLAAAFNLPDGEHLLYAAPPQRKPLTEEEIDKIFKHTCNTVGASYKTIGKMLSIIRIESKNI